jgi:hypothetical protein
VTFDHRFNVALGFAFVGSIAHEIGIGQQLHAYRGPMGEPLPILLQLANGLELPAMFVYRFVLLAGLNELAERFFILLVLLTIFWLLLFEWVKLFRGGSRLDGRPVWIAVSCAVLAGCLCLYVTDDISAVSTFPTMIREAGFTNAAVASGMIQWSLTLVWGVLLIASALAIGNRQFRLETVVKHSPPARKSSARKSSRRKRNRKSH